MDHEAAKQAAYQAMAGGQAINRLAPSRVDLSDINSRLEGMYNNLQDIRSMVGRAGDVMFGSQVFDTVEAQVLNKNPVEPITTDDLLRRCERTLDLLRQQATRF